MNEKAFYDALEKNGYRSISELAKKLKIHRNTIHYYLSRHNVFPSALEKMISALNLDLNDIIVKRESEDVQFEQIAPLLDELSLAFPDVTFILFGSRAKGSFNKYSDWDVGVYRIGGLPHQYYYRKIIRMKNELAEDLPFFIDIVNFNKADRDFLKEASKGWSFLTGNLKGFLELKKKVAI